MPLHIAKPHNPKRCPKKSEKDWSCQCPFYAIGPDPRPQFEGKRFKQCLETTSQTDAVEAMHKVEHRLLHPAYTEFLAEAIGKDPTPAPESFRGCYVIASVARREAVRYTLELMRVFLEKQFKIEKLKHVEKKHLKIFFRHLRTRYALSTLGQHRVNIRAFWHWCAEEGLVDSDPAAALEKTSTKRDATMDKEGKVKTFTPEDLELILYWADRIGGSVIRNKEPEKALKVRALLYTIKFSGMAVVDVMLLRPDNLTPCPDGSGYWQIVKQRHKTGRTCYPTIPPHVKAMLDAFTPCSPDHYFWEGVDVREFHNMAPGDAKDKLEITIRARRNTGIGWIQEVLELANVKGTSHMFRHSLARDLLLQGVGYDVIAGILGDTVTMVQTRYSTFDPERLKKIREAQQNLHLQTARARFKVHQGGAA